MPFQYQTYRTAAADRVYSFDNSYSSSYSSTSSSGNSHGGATTTVASTTFESNQGRFSGIGFEANGTYYRYISSSSYSSISVTYTLSSGGTSGDDFVNQSGHWSDISSTRDFTSSKAIENRAGATGPATTLSTTYEAPTTLVPSGSTFYTIDKWSAVTTSVSTTISLYTSTASKKLTTTSASTTKTAVSNISTEGTLSDVTFSTMTLTTYTESGMVYKAYPWELLFSFTAGTGGAFDTSLHKLEDIATTFSEATLWPNTYAHTVLVVAGSLPLETLSRAASTFTIAENHIVSGDTVSTTVTYGGNLSRQTTSTTFLASSTTIGFIYTGGIDESSISGSGTYTSQQLSYLPNSFEYVSSILSSNGSVSLLMTSISQTFSAIETSGISDVLVQSSINSVSLGSLTQGNTALGVTLRQTHNIYYLDSTNGGYAWGIERVAPARAMQAPLSMGQGQALAANVDATPSSIYYPFISSVGRNVVVPVPKNTTATQNHTSKFYTTTATYFSTYTYAKTVWTDVTTWFYDWASSSLNWTSKTSSTYADGTNTLTTYGTTSGTAELSAMGANTVHNWTTNAGIAGGFPYVTSAAEIANLNAGLALITTYNSLGSSGTDSTFRPSATTTTFHSTAYVEEPLAGYVTFTLAEGGGFAGILTSVRYGVGLGYSSFDTFWTDSEV